MARRSPPTTTAVSSLSGMESHSYRSFSVGIKGPHCSSWDEATGRAGHSLLIDQYHQVWVIDESWILSKLLVGDHVLHELLCWESGCVMPVVYIMDFRTAGSPSPSTYRRRSACCPPGLRTARGQSQASNQNQSPWGCWQASRTAAGHTGGCWGLPQALNPALRHYQQEKKQWQHQAIALDIPLSFALRELLKKV